MSGDRLAGVRAKIERAKRHVFELHHLHGQLMNPGVDAFGYTEHPDRKERIYHLTRDIDIDPLWSVVIGDAIQNIVSALDHLSYALILAGDKVKTTPPPQKFYFPSKASSAEEFPSIRAGTIQGFWNTEPLEVLERIQPYGGGKGEILYQMDRLNIIDKHRLLLTAVASITRSHAINVLGGFKDQWLQDPRLPDNFRAFLLQGDTHFSFPLHEVVCPAKAGQPLFIDSVDAKVDKDYKVPLQIAIHEPQILKCQPVIPLLKQAIDFIETVVLPGFESFC